MTTRNSANDKPQRDFSQVLFPLLLSCVAFLLWQKIDETSTDVKTILSLVSQNTTEISVLKNKNEVLENRVNFLESVVFSNTQKQVSQMFQPSTSSPKPPKRHAPDTIQYREALKELFSAE